jgi:hypothetical protein
MKTGDRVTATPIVKNPTLEELPETVTGKLEIVKGSALEESWNTYIVWVDEDDMYEVEEDSIRPASRRERMKA